MEVSLQIPIIIIIIINNQGIDQYSVNTWWSICEN